MDRADGFYWPDGVLGFTRAEWLAKHGLAPKSELRLVMTVDGGFRPWGQVPKPSP